MYEQTQGPPGSKGKPAGVIRGGGPAGYLKGGACCGDEGCEADEGNGERRGHIRHKIRQLKVRGHNRGVEITRQRETVQCLRHGAKMSEDRMLT